MAYLLSLLFMLLPLSVLAEQPLMAANINANPDVESQVIGDYPSLNRQESLPLGAIQHAWDDAKPGAGVYTVNFNPNEIIKITLREFMTTAIEFPAWEQITAPVEIGDQSNFKITQPKPNVVLIRPNGFIGLDSSMTILGESGHVYAFYIRSEGYNSKNVSDIKIHIRVPTPPFIKNGKNGLCLKQSPTIEEKTDYLENVVFDPAKIDFNYSMSGDKSIAPLRVFSDGVRTWFDYGPDIASKTLPSIYAVIDGVETPINVNREGNKLVAQASGEFALKSGFKTTCVYPSETP